MNYYLIYLFSRFVSVSALLLLFYLNFYSYVFLCSLSLSLNLNSIWFSNNQRKIMKIVYNALVYLFYYRNAKWSLKQTNMHWMNSKSHAVWIQIKRFYIKRNLSKGTHITKKKPIKQRKIYKKKKVVEMKWNQINHTI